MGRVRCAASHWKIITKIVLLSVGVPTLAVAALKCFCRVLCSILPPPAHDSSSNDYVLELQLFHLLPTWHKPISDPIQDKIMHLSLQPLEISYPSMSNLRPLVIRRDRLEGTFDLI